MPTFAPQTEAVRIAMIRAIQADDEEDFLGLVSRGVSPFLEWHTGESYIMSSTYWAAIECRSGKILARLLNWNPADVLEPYRLGPAGYQVFLDVAIESNFSQGVEMFLARGAKCSSRTFASSLERDEGVLLALLKAHPEFWQIRIGADNLRSWAKLKKKGEILKYCEHVAFPEADRVKVRRLCKAVLAGDRQKAVEALNQGGSLDDRTNEDLPSENPFLLLQGWTPLQIAASKKDLKMVSFLLGRGASPNPCAAWDVPPLWIAASEGGPGIPIIEELLDRGADATFRWPDGTRFIKRFENNPEIMAWWKSRG